MRISFLVIIGLLLFLPQVGADDLTVCESGCNHSQIQSAISTSQDGDEIIISPGTYHENLYIDKSVKLVGKGAFLQPSASYIPPIRISAGNVILEDLKIVEGSTGVQIVDGEKISIFNCTFSHNTIGISLRDSSDCKIVENGFSSNDIHISLQNSSNSLIYQNRMVKGSTGVALVDSNSNNLTENKFELNEAGVCIESSQGNRVTGNYFEGCRAGIYSVLSSDNYFSGNKVANTSVFVDLRQCSSHKISKNVIENGTYSKVVDGAQNLYTLKNLNISGEQFEISLFKPPVFQEYVNLSQGVNIILTSPNSTDTVSLKAHISPEDLGELNSSSIGIYRIGDNLTATAISNDTLGDDNHELELTASVTQSGKYILLAKKEENKSLTLTAISNPEGATTEGIIMFAVVIASIVVMLYILSKGK